MYPGLDTNCRVPRRSKCFSIKASIHKTANIKAHIKGTSTSKIKHVSITAIYNKGINQYTHQGHYSRMCKAKRQEASRTERRTFRKSNASVHHTREEQEFEDPASSMETM